MPLLYDEAILILRFFKEKYFWIPRSPGVNSLIVTEDSSGPQLEVGVENMDRSLGLPSRFTVSTTDAHYDVGIKITQRYQAWPLGALPSRTTKAKQLTSPEAAPLRPGQSARGDGASGTGTAGWFFYRESLDDRGRTRLDLVCISNWHVFCTRGNASQRGVQRCIIKGADISVLHDYEDIGSYNRYDVAYAKIDDANIEDIDGHMTLCADGTEFTYPSDWTSAGHVRIGANVHKVGLRTGCTHGTLRAIGDLEVTGIGYFDGQLLFETDYLDHGDSGSITILDDDDSVMGLNFAGSDSGTWANPIYQSGLVPVGWRRTRSGLALPVFTGPLNPVRSDKSLSSRTIQEELPHPGKYYICGFAESESAPSFDGDVHYLGADYVGSGSNTIGRWLLLGKSNAANAMRIKTARRTNHPRYRPTENEVLIWTITGIGGFGTIIELVPVSDASGLLCFGVSVKTDNRWTVGPPAAREELHSILVAEYHEEPDPGSGHQKHIQRYLYWGR